MNEPAVKYLPEGKALGLDLFCKICGDVFSSNRANMESGLCVTCRRDLRYVNSRQEKNKKRLEDVKHDLISVLKRRISSSLSSDIRRIKLLENKRIKTVTDSSKKLSMNYLLNIYFQQKGLCALTGKPLSLGPLRLPDGRIDKNNLSIDRIDPTLPHIKGNVRFVTYFANIAKREFTDREFVELCWNVISHFVGERNDETNRRFIRNLFETSEIPSSDEFWAFVESNPDLIPGIDISTADGPNKDSILDNTAS